MYAALLQYAGKGHRRQTDDYYRNAATGYISMSRHKLSIPISEGTHSRYYTHTDIHTGMQKDITSISCSDTGITEHVDMSQRNLLALFLGTPDHHTASHNTKASQHHSSASLSVPLSLSQPLIIVSLRTTSEKKTNDGIARKPRARAYTLLSPVWSVYFLKTGTTQSCCCCCCYSLAL